MTRSPLLLPVVLPLLLTGAGWGEAAQEEETGKREEELFGEPGEPEPGVEEADQNVKARQPARREREREGSEGSEQGGTGTERTEEGSELGLEEPVLTEGLVGSRLAESNDRLVLGGQLYLRFHGSLDDDDGAPDELGLSSPTLLHLYLDGRPSDRLRAFARGRLVHDATIAEGGETDELGRSRSRSEVFLDQLWLKFDIARTVYVTAGRQPIRWGSGRFWNPTDFLNQQRRDPLALLDERLGISLVKLHVPLESLGWNVYAVANFDEADSPADVGGAVRAEALVGPGEIALSAAARKDQATRLGADLSFGVGDFDLRLEGAVAHGEKKEFWRGSLDFAATPTPYSREDDWIAQLTAGAEIAIRYSDEDNVVLGSEYFYNDAGYGDATLYPWLAYQGDFTPFYLGRHYVSAYAALMSPGRWNDTSFIGSAIGNVSDGTWLARLDYQVRVLTYLDLSAFAAVHLCDQGEFRFAVSIPPSDSFPQGLDIPAQRLDLGVWLTLRI
ncbi:MAG: hypothetical protein V2A73_16715 [Pseudomonadota bacterium]